MCRNGEISFEDFYSAMSSVFGNDIQDTRISQLASIIGNLVKGFWNLARTVSGIVGPVIYAFFQVFNTGGVKGIMGITQAFAEFTQTLVTSRETQEKIRSLAFSLFSILKSGIKVVLRVASAIIKIAQALAPLIIQVLEFADVIASVISYVVDIIVESRLLNSIIAVLTKAIQVAGYVIINVFRIILGIVRPVIKAVGEVFAFLARSIGSVDVSFIDVILGAFQRLVDTIANGGIVTALTNAVQIIFLTIERMFKGLTLSFEVVSEVLYNASERIATICDRVVEIFSKLKNSIVYVFTSLQSWLKALVDQPQKIIALIGQLTSLTLLLRFAQTMRGIGRSFSGLGNMLNSNAILAFTNAIKTLATAILEFSVAIVLLSSIPATSLQTTIALMKQLTISVAIFLGMYFAYMYMIARLNNKIIADPMVRFMNKLNASINSFLQSIGRAANIAALALLLVAMAASLGLLFKAVKQFSTFDEATFQTGFWRIASVIAALTFFLGTIAFANGSRLGNVRDSVIFGRSGLMGAAVVMMALLVVLRAFEQIIIEYNSMNISEEDYYYTLGRIAFVLFGLASAIAIIGLAVKQAGFGLLGSVSAMMAFLTVLQGFEEIIRLYVGLYSGENALDPDILSSTFATISAIFWTVVAGVSMMALALSEGRSSFSAFQGGLKQGIQFQSNSSKFIGVILTMLSLCLVLQTAASVMAVIGANAGENQENAGVVIGLLLVIFGGMYMVIKSMNGISAGSIVGLGIIIVTLSAVLPILASFDWQKIAVSAASLFAVIISLTLMMKSLSGNLLTWQEGLGFAILMFMTLNMVATAIASLTAFDATSVLDSGLAIASIVAAFGAAFKLMNGATFSGGAIAQMFLTLLTLIPIIIAFAGISNIAYDPFKLLGLVTTVSLLAIAIGGMVRIMNGVELKNAGTLFVTLIGIASMITMLAYALVGATNLLSGDVADLGLIALFINGLIPIIALLAGLSMAMSSLETSINSVLMMGIIVALVSGLIGAITMAATIGNPEGTVRLMEGIQKSLLGMIGLIGTIAALSIVFGLISSTAIGAAGLLAGIALMGLMLTELALFIRGIAASATLGDADSTVTLLNSLGYSLDAMVPFLLKMGGICALFGVFSPLLAAGSIGFGILLTVISAFVGMIAVAATIGNPEDTVTLLMGLTKAMDRFSEFLGHFALVLTILGMVAPLAAVGAMVFKTILDILSQFAMSMAVIGASGNPSSTISVMGALTDALRELVDSFLVIMVLGAMAVPVIAGMLMITTAMGLLLGVSYIIGQIDAIKNTIVSGIATILLSAESLVLATTVMNGIDLGAIMQFIFAMALISATPMVGISKFAFIATTMTMLGVSSSLILKGSKTTVEMFKDLYASVELMNAITRTNTKGLRNVTEDILQSAINLANVGKYIGVWVPYSIADGVLSNSGLQTLATAGYLMAKVLEESIRDTMQIHSESPLYNVIGGWVPKSEGTGLLNNIGSLMSAGSEGMQMFGNSQFDLAGMYGNQAGGNFIASMEDAIVSGLNYLKENNVINDYYQYFANGVITEHTARVTGMSASETSDAAQANNDYANSLNNLDTATQNLINNNGSRPYFSPNLVVEEDSTDAFLDDLESQMGDFTDFSWLTKDLGDAFNLGSIGDSIGDAFGGLDEDATSASKSVDQLTNKIDDLMDKYENLWEDAKERANKDLFKGVDKQGDDFLDSVQDIMDKFKNIYQDAVEKTNGQDLFAEVKDEDESFAPETLLNNLEDQVNQVNELNTIIGSLGGRIADNGLRAAISAMDVDNLPELRALYRMDDAQLREYESMYQKKVQANQNKIQNELTGSLSQLTGQYTDVATYVATDASTNALVRNLQSQIDQLNEYNSTVSSLTGRIKDVNLREAIAHMGVESLDELKALNRMTNQQLDEYTAMYNAKISQEAQVIKNELSTELSALLNEPVDISEFYLNYRGTIDETVGEVTEKAGEKAGNSIGTGMARGMSGTNVVATARNSGKDLTTAVSEGISDEEGTEKVVGSTKSIVEQIVEVLQNPRNQFKESGLKIVDKIIEGLVRGRESRDFYDAVAHLCDKVCTIIEDKNEMFVNVGRMITLGVAAGIRNESAVNTVKNAAISMVSSTLKEAYKTAKINSPSKVTEEMGMYLDEGLAVGLRKYSDVAADEAGEMAGNSVSAIQEAIQRMSGMLDGSIDLNPVITPTLDLSEINARSSALANMFTGRQIAVQARADDQQAEMMTQLGNILAEQNAEPKSITFNQTNNSPKALSRTEIYRQTRNAFSQLASAVQ